MEDNIPIVLDSPEDEADCNHHLIRTHGPIQGCRGHPKTSLSILFDSTERAWRAAVQEPNMEKSRSLEDETQTDRPPSLRPKERLYSQTTLKSSGAQRSSLQSTASSIWEGAMIYLEEATQDKGPRQQIDTVDMLLEPLEVSILDNVAQGSLINRENSINIISGLAEYYSAHFNNIAVKDLRDRCEAVWKQLHERETTITRAQSSALADFDLQRSQLISMNNYVCTLSQLLHQQHSERPPSSESIADNSNFGGLVKAYWEQYFRVFRAEHSKFCARLQAKTRDVKTTGNISLLEELQRETRQFNKNAWEDFVGQFQEEIRKPMRLEELIALEELKDSYDLFRSLKLTEARSKQTTLDLIEEHDQIWTCAADNIDEQISQIDHNLEACETLLISSAANIRRATTRVQRLAVVDIKDPNERLREAERRFGPAGSSNFWSKAHAEVTDTLGFIGTAKIIMDKVEKDLKGLDGGAVIDVRIAAETALLSFMADQEKIVEEQEAKKPMKRFLCRQE